MCHTVQAKIGRAASFNSPAGLWPLPPQRGIPPEPLVRQSSARQFGARQRGGEEGRVRGGLPHIFSTLSLNASTPRSSSPASTPRGRASFEGVLQDDGRQFPQKVSFRRKQTRLQRACSIS